MKSKSLFQVAGLIAAVTILSKFIGFARDVVIAKSYGATLVSDAYFYAYQIPALALILLGGLGGPFHTATIAYFSKAISDISGKPEAKVQNILNSFLTIVAIVFCVIAILIYFYSDNIVSLIASGASSELHHLASTQLKIMSPIILIGGIIGIFYGIANVYKEFLITSLSPSILSIVLISALLFFNNDSMGLILAWGTLFGAIGQLLIQLPIFFKSGFIYKPEFNIINPDMNKIGEILFPAMLGTTIGQINIYVDMFFASQLKEGAWSAIGYANRIFQFPTGVIITALLIPLFPMFSTFVGKRDWESLKSYFHQGLASLWFIAFPVFALILLFAQDGVKLLFERGAFNASDTLMVSEVLVYLSISIIPYVARDTITRIFYSFDDSRTPFYVAIFSIFIKTLMNFLLIKPFGIAGIALSTTIVTLVNAILLALLLKSKIKLDYLKFVQPLLKIITATVLMSIVLYYFNIYLLSLFNDDFIYLFIRLLIIAIIAVISYLGLGLLLRINSAQQLIAKAGKKVLK